MKRIFIILILLILTIFSLSGCSDNKNNNNENRNLSPNISNNSNNISNSNLTNNTIIEKVSINTEEEISNFSTKVYDKSEDRKTNVDITISKIDGYKLEPRSNIFFL